MSKIGEQVRGRISRLAKKITVPEWGEDDQPLELFFYPLSVNGAKKINSHLKSKGESTRELEYVYFIVFNALTAHGDPAFDLADVEWISNEPLNIIFEIYLAANDRSGFTETLAKAAD